MIYAFRKHAGKILLATLFAFVAGIFLMGIRQARFSGAPRRARLQRPAAHVLATINDEPINPFKYSQVYRQFVSSVESSGREMEPYLNAALQYQALAQTIEYQLTLLKAREDKVRASRGEVNHQIKAIAKANKLTVNDLKQHLASQGYPFDRFKENIRSEIVVTKFLRQHEDSVRITDEDIEWSLSQLRASHILISGPDLSQAEQIATGILQRAKAGEDFASLAKQYSADTFSAKKGGDVGWFSAGTMVPEFEKAALSLNPGEIYAQLVKTVYGFHVIKLLDFKKRELPPDMDMAVYRKNLLENKKSKVIDSLINTIRKKAEIKILSESHLAYKLQAEGKYKAAIVKYQKLTAENPRSYVPYLFVGDLHTKLDDYERAFAAYKKAETIQDLNPQSKDGLVLLAKGLAYIRQGKAAQDAKKYREKKRYFQLAGKQLLLASDQAGNRISTHREIKRSLEEIKWTRAAKEEAAIMKRLERERADAKQQAEQPAS